MKVAILALLLSAHLCFGFQCMRGIEHSVKGSPQPFDPIKAEDCDKGQCLIGEGSFFLDDIQNTVQKVRGCVTDCKNYKNDYESLQDAMEQFGNYARNSFVTETRDGDKPTKIICCKGDKCNDVATVADVPDDVIVKVSGSDVIKSRYVIAVIITFAAFL